MAITNMQRALRCGAAAASLIALFALAGCGGGGGGTGTALLPYGGSSPPSSGSGSGSGSGTGAAPAGWTWESGASAEGAIGVYGTQGTAAAANVPGSRWTQNEWIDASGNVWIFGGFGADDTGSTLGPLNDLWMFDPATGQWTWENGDDVVNQAGVYGTEGTAAAGNMPGARYAAMTWAGAAGEVLFGGDGYGATAGTRGYLNDLWVYSAANNEWDWVGGSQSVDGGGVYGTEGTAAATNWPGARAYSATTTDGSGMVWLFGGYGEDSTGATGELNDLWQWNPATSEWTWVSGSSTLVGRGTYGTLGVAASTNVPGPRDEPVIWSDSAGDLWVFGGYGADSTAAVGYLNDLWMYDPATQMWTWEGGSDLANQAGTYGTQGTASATNWPGARGGAVVWQDASGAVWLAGGQGIDSAGTSGDLNDAWEFDPSTKEWTWKGGSDLANQAGAYGTQGTASATNWPGARQYATGALDGAGNLWLFGGAGYDGSGASGNLNDLWKYTP